MKPSITHKPWFLFTSQIAQRQYPQRLGVLFLYEAPAIFSGLWKAVQPFVDEDTRKRVQFISEVRPRWAICCVDGKELMLMLRSQHKMLNQKAGVHCTNLVST